MSDKQLMAVFGFDENDLLANRAKRFSPRQQERLKPPAASPREDRSMRWVQRVVLGVVILIAVLPLCLTFYRLGAPDDTTLTILFVALGLTLATAIILIIFIVLRTMGEPLFKPLAPLLHVSSVTDRAQIVVQIERRELWLYVGRKQFALTDAQVKALRDGERYMVYCETTTNTLLSIEHHPDNTAPQEALIGDAMPQELPSVRISDDGELRSMEDDPSTTG
jgi:hypothetical protein